MNGIKREKVKRMLLLSRKVLMASLRISSFLSFLVHLTLAAGPHPRRLRLARFDLPFCHVLQGIGRLGVARQSSCLTWGSFGFLLGCGLALRCGAAVTGRKKGDLLAPLVKKAKAKGKPYWVGRGFVFLPYTKENVLTAASLLLLLISTHHSFIFFPSQTGKKKKKKKLLAGTSLMGRRGV